MIGAADMQDEYKPGAVFLKLFRDGTQHFLETRNSTSTLI
ncbi:MAG: hypothetical protein JWL75_729 [Parcubacteria group bacterium]|nr:hypothetical protein [Parcubacteria group bacterium]